MLALQYLNGQKFGTMVTQANDKEVLSLCPLVHEFTTAFVTLTLRIHTGVYIAACVSHISPSLCSILPFVMVHVPTGCWSLP